MQFSDGRLGILETKDQNDRDGATSTTAKSEALHQYIKKQPNKKLFGGIVIQKGTRWLINQKANYDWEKCERGDWSDWDDLEFTDTADKKNWNPKEVKNLSPPSKR